MGLILDGPGVGFFPRGSTGSREKPLAELSQMNALWSLGCDANG
jgi:hypothetical protein